LKEDPARAARSIGPPGPSGGRRGPTRVVVRRVWLDRASSPNHSIAQSSGHGRATALARRRRGCGTPDTPTRSMVKTPLPPPDRNVSARAHGTPRAAVTHRLATGGIVLRFTRSPHPLGARTMARSSGRAPARAFRLALRRSLARRLGVGRGRRCSFPNIERNVVPPVLGWCPL
jgi:hypothetical protein